jgi:tetratricopeptide (TPR) repeat protein
MRSTAVRLLVVLGILGGLLLADLPLGLRGRSAAGAETRKPPKGFDPRQLTDDQVKKIRSQIKKKRANRNKKTTGGKVNPGKASLTAVATLYKEGEAAFQAENYAGAYEYFIDVAACRRVQGAAGYASKASARLLEMEKAAAAKLDEAKLARLQGKGAEALDIVKILLEKYPYCKAAEGANNLLVALSNDPRVAAAVALVKAEELDKAGKYAEAAKAYAKLMTKYPGTVQALKCKLRLKAMKQDEEISKLIDEAKKSAADTECPRILIMARNYSTNKLYPQARALYEKIVKKYPDSEYAKQAREALKEIKGKEAEADAAKSSGKK